MENEKKIIYLDNNATTQIDDQVFNAMLPFLKQNYANANSTHLFGVGVNEAVKKSRKQVAEILSAEPNEIVFTSGATEAINIAIKGVAESYSNRGKHIITSATEHKAVLDTCASLESKGFEITYLPVKPDGLICLNDLQSALREDTILVSIMYVNNETGVIQPIKDIAALSHSVDALFMTDATQAVGKLKLDVDLDEIDLLTFSGHKIYGAKGVGALYVRQRMNRVRILPLHHGGGHERGVRSGTLNVPGIISIGKACEFAIQEFEQNNLHIKVLRDYLENDLLSIPGTTVNGSIENRVYNVSNICFEGVDSEALIMSLSNSENDLPMIAVSNGSACTSSKIDPSHVLLAMGLNETQAFNSIRFSLGKYNTKEELTAVCQLVKKSVKTLRDMSFNL